MSFETALPLILRYEGGYVNDPDDPGGATNYGVTQAVYDDFRDENEQAPRPVKLITMDEVRAIYERNYWRLCGAPALIAANREKLATIAFDWAVNAGVERARWYVQAAVGTRPDGLWGEDTLRKIALADEATACATMLHLRALHYRGRAGDLGALAALREAGLAKIAPRANLSQAKFLPGWLARLRRLAKTLGIPVQPSFAKPA